MGVLRVGGGAAFPAALGLADVVLAPAPADVAFGGGGSLVRDAQRVGTHIGDQTHRAMPGDVHAFIQRLSCPHGAGGGKAVAAAGLLLQGGGDEGRRGHPVALALFQLAHHIVFALQRGEDAVRLLLVGDGQLFAGGGGGQPRRERRAPALRFQVGVDVPVFVGLKLFDFQLPIPDEAHRHALHAARGQAPAHLAPQKRRQLVAHQTVQLPPGLLGIEQVHVDGAGMGHALLDALFGNFIKGHPVGRGGVQPQHVRQMPADGLPFPVRVGCQQNAVTLLGLRLQFLHQLGLALDGDVFRRVAVFHVNAQLGGGQVPDMAHAGSDLISPAQIFADGLGLGGGFHDNEFWHCDWLLDYLNGLAILRHYCPIVRAPAA